MTNIQALHHQAGVYDAFMISTPAVKQALSWLIKILHNQQINICHGNLDLINTTYVCAFGWSAICGNVNLGLGGRCNNNEIQNNTNRLELLAASHALKLSCKAKTNIWVQILSDNSCTVSHI